MLNGLSHPGAPNSVLLVFLTETPGIWLLKCLLYAIDTFHVLPHGASSWITHLGRYGFDYVIWTRVQGTEQPGGHVGWGAR